MPPIANDHDDSDTFDPSNDKLKLSKHRDSVDGNTSLPQAGAESKSVLEYATKAENLEARCLVQVSTASSISTDTVTSLGGEDKARTFVESVTAEFTQSFSAELDRRLHEACGYNDSREKISFDHSRSAEDGHGSSVRRSGTSHTPWHGPKVHEQIRQASEGEATKSTATGSRTFDKLSSKHLEDFSITDLPVHSVESLRADSDSNTDASLSKERPMEQSDEDARENIESTRSPFTESGPLDCESDEDDRSVVGTEDLIAVLQKVDEVIESCGHFGFTHKWLIQIDVKTKEER